MRPYVTFSLLFLLSSCLKETSVPIASSFELTIGEDKTSPVTVKLQNNSYGADEYEWTFEGGVPSSSSEKNPESVTFTEAGEHKIRLRVWNAVEERISEQVIRVDSAMNIDFAFRPDGSATKLRYQDDEGNWGALVDELPPLSPEELSLLWLDYPQFGDYEQLIRLDRIPTIVRERILEYIDREFPAFREHLQRDIEKYQGD